MEDTIIDDSCLEQEEEHQNLSGYYEVNEDDCYEFGGYPEDRNSNHHKSFFQELKEAIPFLMIMLLFCLGVFYWSFHNVH